MDDPFELPASIKEIRVGKGEATVVHRDGGAIDPLQSPLQYLKGVGPRRAADLERVGLHTVEDLLYRFPIRYEDRGTFQTIARTAAGRHGVGPRRSRRLRHSSDAPAAIQDLRAGRPRSRPGSLRAIWFNQPFLNDVFRPHQRVILFGKLELTSHGLQLQNPQYEVLPQEPPSEGSGGDTGPAGESPAVPDPVPDDDTLHTGRIVPIYEKTGTVTTKMQRVLVHHALAQLPDVLPDPLPAALRARHDLLDRRTAITRRIFRPSTPTSTS